MNKPLGRYCVIELHKLFCTIFSFENNERYNHYNDNIFEFDQVRVIMDLNSGGDITLHLTHVVSKTG